ncbi:hypothetical protein ACHAW5_003550 [Stephanodiscus triporus]|uniref:Uncharacterized protein n=1 Tax=Stephanodiscus triporus TaxID=2934178 RepID=A0ABD3MSG4_9STRA
MKTARGNFSVIAQGDSDGDNSEPDQPPKKRPKPVVPRLVPKSHANESDKLVTNQLLLEVSSRMDDVISELIEYASVLSDQSGRNEPKRHAVIKNIKESILPMLYIASRTVRETGMSFAPFGGTGSLHLRNESQKKKEVVDKKITDKSTALQMIDYFVKNSIVDIPQQLASFNAKEASSTCLQDASPKKHETVTISILRPRNGSVYTRTEAIHATRMYAKRSRKRGLAVRAMIEKGYAHASAKTINRLVQAYEDGHPPVGELWNGTGAPRKHQVDPALDAAAAIVAAAPKPVGRPMPEDMIEITLTKRAEEQRADESFVVTEKLHETSNTKTNKKKNSTLKALEGLHDKTKKKSSGKKAATLLPKQSATKLPATKLSPKPKERKTKLIDAINFPLPKPHGGITYTKSEAVNIASQYKKGSKERRRAIDSMLRMGYVPNSVKSVYRLLQKQEKGIPIIDTEWGSGGSPALLSNDEVNSIIEKMKQEEVSFDRVDLEQVIREKVVRTGGDPDSKLSRISKTSLKNYETLFRSKLNACHW